jgi:hypothetical protein
MPLTGRLSRGARRSSRHGARQETAQGRGEALEIPGQRLAEVTQEVKAIRDLDGVRCACCRATRIGRGAITRNDFPPGVGAEPGRHGLGGAFREEGDRPPAFEIDQDRAIDPPLPEGTVIDAEHPGCGLGRRRGPA